MPLVLLKQAPERPQTLQDAVSWDVWEAFPEGNGETVTVFRDPQNFVYAFDDDGHPYMMRNRTPKQFALDTCIHRNLRLEFYDDEEEDDEEELPATKSKDPSPSVRAMLKMSPVDMPPVRLMRLAYNVEDGRGGKGDVAVLRRFCDRYGESPTAGTRDWITATLEALEARLTE